MKLCNQTFSRVLISNMTMLFSNSSPKISKSHFCMKFCNQTNLRVLISNVTIVFFKFQSNKTNLRISNMTMVFSNYGSKIRKFLFPDLRIFIFQQISNMTMAFSNSSLKIPKQSIFCRKCKQFSFLYETSHIEKFERTDCENGNSFFSNSSQQYETFFENSKVFSF